MKKEIKTEKVLQVYNIVNTAKYTKMNDDDKVKIWKIVRILKPIATKFDEDAKDAAEKLRPSEDFTERLQKAQQFERAKQEGKEYDGMASTEYAQFIDEFKEYNDLVNKAVKEFADTIVELEFNPISEDAFGKLMASNDWNMEQATIVGDFILE